VSTSRTRRARTILGAVILMLVAGAVVAHQFRQSRKADDALARAGAGIQLEVQRFHRQHAEYPGQLRLHPGAVQLIGTSITRTNTIDLDSGVRLVWYTDSPDPRLSTSSQMQGNGFSYCLAFHGRYWRLNANEDGVGTRGAGGGCPASPAP
jgi:hypothetical protein